MHLIVGLGNPGKEYMETRHNVGWTMLSHFIEHEGLPSFVLSAKYSAQISAGVVKEKDVLVILPQTYMNRSGVAVKKAFALSKDTDMTLIVVYDDIDLPVGSIKISHGRGAGGHNGVQSIIDTLGTKEFTRVRVGIGQKGILEIVRRPRGEALSKYVLAEFTKAEQEKLVDVGEHVHAALVLILEEGVPVAMNSMN
jgi:PTH1 family peptidyl-tRNA hydrolase